MEEPLRARVGSAGFGQSEAENLCHCPEGSWFLRYILQQTVGSFSEGFLEPLLEYVGLRNLANLKRKRNMDFNTAKSALLLQYKS